MQGVPLPDGEGLVDTDALREFANSVSRGQFESAFPMPALRLRMAALPPAASESRSPTERMIQPTSDEETGAHDTRERAAPRPPRQAIAFLRKRPGNPFPAIISIGRAANNDIALLFETISKVHAYLVNEGSNLWLLADNRSKNGTALNKKALEPSKRYPVRDGDEIQIGFEVGATLLFPATLYDRLRGA